MGGGAVAGVFKMEAIAGETADGGGVDTATTGGVAASGGGAADDAGTDAVATGATPSGACAVPRS